MSQPPPPPPTPPRSDPPPPRADDLLTPAHPTPAAEPTAVGGAWGVGGAVGGVAMAIGLVFLGSLPVIAIAGDTGLDATIGSQLVLEAAFLATALYFASKGVSGLAAAFRALGLHRPQVSWLGPTAITFVAYLGFAIIFSQLVADPEQVDVADQLGFDQSTLGAISAGILIVLLAPLAEEVFFRGLFFGGLRARFPFLAAALLSGAFFGVIHLVGGNWAVAVQLGVLGVALAYLYERTGTLWAPITLHGVNNALAFLVLVTT